MKTKIILVLTMFLVQLSFSQKKSRADRFFETGDYINAAIQYEEALNQQGYSKPILTKIATSYYNTFQFKQAYRYLAVLTAGRFYQKDKTYDNSFNFMMYQVLSSLGKYDKAVDFLALYQKNEDGTELNKAEAISTIEAFKLKDDDYTLQEMQFNSEASEFGAIKRDSIIYFTTDNSSGFIKKNYKWTHRPFLDILKVKVDDQNAPISEIESISSVINSSLHEGNFCFTSDGNTIYFSKSNSEKGKKRFDSLGNNTVYLYKSLKVDGVWQTPEKLPINEVGYSMEHPSLNVDDTTLYFASNIPSGYGGFDLYAVTINIDGTYGVPKNLGATINTNGREQFPFVAKDNHLFFSSNGHLGLGMMDIFVSESKEGILSKPVNLGAPINSSYDDFSMSYYNETDGFFATNRKNKTDDDLYSFSQIGEIFLKEYMARFEVREYGTDAYIPNASVVLYDGDQQIIYEKQLDTVGGFDISVFPGKYDFKASSDAYEAKVKPVLVKEKEEQTYIIYLEKREPSVAEKIEDTIYYDSNKTEAISLSGDDSKIKKAKPLAEEIKKELIADTEGPQVVERNGKLYFDLPPIYFDFDKWNIRADSKKVLDDFALKLEKYKTVYIKIDAHTDSRGTASYNQLLSERRAESTRNYLALVGYVNARRMEFQGFGESKPLVTCESKVCSEEEYQMNRRSEFEIIKY